MSKYIVLYTYQYSVEEPFIDPHWTTESGKHTVYKSKLSMESFDELKDAVKCMNEHDGQLLKTVETTVSEL